MSEVVCTKRKALEEGKDQEKKRSKLEEKVSEKLTLSALLSVGGPVANVLGKLTGWDSQTPLYNIRNPTMLIHAKGIEHGNSTIIRISYASLPEHFLVSYSNDRPFLVRFIQPTESVNCCVNCMHRRKALTLDSIINRIETSLSNFEHDDDDSVVIRLVYSEKKSNENGLSPYGPLGDIPEYGEDVPTATRDRFFDLAKKKFGRNYFDTGKNRWGSLSWRLLWNRQHQYVQENSFSSLGVGSVYCCDQTYRWCADAIDNYDKLCSGEIRIL